ncbi:glycosyl hydrolase, partial [Streptomyces sp. SID6041]|nr:glycosyl hydrolase [Streptomyces sp. SID6041]
MRTPGRGRARFLLTALACTLGCLLPVSPAHAAPAHRDHGTGTGTESTAAAPEFQQVTLAKGVAETGEPMTLAVLPDRSVLHTSRDGTLRLTDAAGTTTVAGRLDVYSHDEEGLQGVAADP